MVGTTKDSNQEYHENHELQALSDPQLDMVADSNREYQAVATLDGEEDPLVTTHDDMSNIPTKGISSDVSS